MDKWLYYINQRRYSKAGYTVMHEAKHDHIHYIHLIRVIMAFLIFIGSYQTNQVDKVSAGNSGHFMVNAFVFYAHQKLMQS